MTAIVQVLSVYTIVFLILPSTWFDGTDRLTLFRRHQIFCNFCLRIPTAVKTVQITVIFVRLRFLLLLGKFRLIVIDGNIRLTLILRNLLDGFDIIQIFQNFLNIRICLLCTSAHIFLTGTLFIPKSGDCRNQTEDCYKNLLKKRIV